MNEKTGEESPFQIECCPKCGCNVVTNQTLQRINELSRGIESDQTTPVPIGVNERRLRSSIDSLADSLSLLEDNSDFIELRAAKAIPSDVGLGRVRLPLNNHLELKPGDIVCIEGATGPLASRGRTPAVVWRARPEDSRIGVARVDGIVRKNAKVGLGDRVRIRKVNPESCSELFLAPDLEGERFNDLTSHFKRFKLGKGVSGFALRGLNKRPVQRGDLVFIPGLSLMGEPLPFLVKDTNPHGIVTVGPETNITMLHPESEGNETGPEESRLVAQNWCCKTDSHPPESKPRSNRPELQGEGDSDPTIETLSLVLRELDFSQRQLMHIIARMISKSDDLDSNAREKRVH